MKEFRINFKSPWKGPREKIMKKGDGFKTGMQFGIIKKSVCTNILEFNSYDIEKLFLFPAKKKP